MKPVVAAGIALCLVTPAYATDVQGCDTPEQLAAHATALTQIIAAMRAGNASDFAALVPDGTYVDSVDFARERLASRPFTAADLEKLATSYRYILRKQQTSPPYLCSSLIVKWTRPGDSHAHWMTSFEFRNGVLVKVSETDLIELEKRGPPPAPPPPRP